MVVAGSMPDGEECTMVKWLTQTNDPSLDSSSTWGYRIADISCYMGGYFG